MTTHYTIVEVHPDWIPDPEQMGSKQKFWYSVPGDNGSRWLFKRPRQLGGEHWAEKIASEVAKTLGIIHAPVELALFDGGRGSVTKSFGGDDLELIHGNEVLKRVDFPDGSSEPNFHQSGHTLENIWQALDTVLGASDAAINAKLQFAEYLVLDAVIGNVDRHSENWGLLQQRDNGALKEFLAPSFDHGSSLGRELSDERRTRQLDGNHVGEYSERGRGGIFWSESDRHGLSPLELVRQAVPEYSELLGPALATLDRLNEPTLRSIVDRTPAEWMTTPARQFAFELMRYNWQQLQGAPSER